MDDPRFWDGYLRTQHYEELEPIINQAFKTKTTQEWLDELEKVAIPCGAVNTIDKVAADPQVTARRMILEISHPPTGPIRVINSPVKMSRTPSLVVRPSPELGEHTDELLGTLLSLTPEQIAGLRQSSVI